MLTLLKVHKIHPLQYLMNFPLPMISYWSSLKPYIVIVLPYRSLHNSSLNQFPPAKAAGETGWAMYRQLAFNIQKEIYKERFTHFLERERDEN